MASGHENSEDPVTSVIEEVVYVAVGTDVKDCKSFLLWALRNVGGKRICIAHVHRPAKRIPNGLGGHHPASSLDERIVRDYKKTEGKIMNETLEEYLSICRQEGVQAQKVWIEMDDIGKGIVELISHYGIKELVMGGALDEHYKEKMNLKSKKAKYVCKRAPLSCRVQFICRYCLIHTREASSYTETGAKHLISRSVTLGHDRDNAESAALNSRSKSVTLGHNRDITEARPSNCLRSNSVTLGYERDNGGKRIMDIPFEQNIEERSYPKSRLNVKVEGTRSSSEWDESSISPGPTYSTFSPKKVVDATLTSWNEIGLDLSSISPASANSKSPVASSLLKPSPTLTSSASTISTCTCNGARSVVDGSSLYEKLQQAMSEAEMEAQLRRQAQRDLIEAICEVQEEVKQRKEIEEALVKEREELQKLKNLKDQMMEELRISKEEKTLLKRQNEELQKKRDEFEIERDNALQEAEGLRKKQAEASRQMPEFLLSEIEEATHLFDESLIIGRGGYGNVYKGLLHQTEVAIKRLKSNGSQGSSEFEMEVRALSQLTHPNIVRLIGCCSEAFVLVYEYLPNGSLEDRLYCKNRSTPLSWQTRIQIMTELCSVLIYLHSRKPHSIVHGDLKPSNILLDTNFKSKLSDFGICRILCHERRSTNDTTVCHFTNPKGTFHYIDPDSYETRKLTRKSDVYSFGVILLQLLTGLRPPFMMENDVQVALDAGKLSSLLDPLAGNWPIEIAQNLAHLALRCCDRYRKNRPDLSSEVRKVLESMRNSCVAASSRG